MNKEQYLTKKAPTLFAVREHRDPMTDEMRRLRRILGVSEDWCRNCGTDTIHVHNKCTNCEE